MIEVKFTGATSAEVIAQVQEFLKQPNAANTEGGSAAGSKTKKAAAAPEEDKPAKSADIDDAAIRAKIKEHELEVLDAKAFIKKFGFESVTQIPAKKRPEFMEQLDEFAALTPKKRKEFLADGDDL